MKRRSFFAWLTGLLAAPFVRESEAEEPVEFFDWLEENELLISLEYFDDALWLNIVYYNDNDVPGDSGFDYYGKRSPVDACDLMVAKLKTENSIRLPDGRYVSIPPSLYVNRIKFNMNLLNIHREIGRVYVD